MLMRAHACIHRPLRQQQGFTLIEVLVSVLVFSLGVLAMVGLQGSAIRLSTDAQLRADATFLADQLLGRMLIADPTTAATFDHNPSGTVCSPTAAASTNATVVEWLAEVNEILPNAPPENQQIDIDTATGQVTVTLCWENGSDGAHRLVVQNQVQWQP
jgi:type IV pilus assembly protein PilV